MTRSARHGSRCTIRTVFVNESTLTFVPYDRRFLEASRAWLRDPEIARLTMTAEFTDEGQEAWFASLPGKTDYRAFGVELDGVPVGVTGLKRITPTDGEYFGFLGAKELWGQRIGAQLVERVVTLASELGLESVHLRVHSENERAIRLYEKCAFAREGVDGDVVLMRRWMMQRR